MALHQVPTRVNFTSSSAIAFGICHPTNSAGRMSHQRHGRVVNRFLQNCGLDCVTPLRDPTFIRIANLVACTHLCRTNCFRMHLLSFSWFVCPTRQNLQQTFSAPRHDLLGFSQLFLQQATPRRLLVSGLAVLPQTWPSTFLTLDLWHSSFSSCRATHAAIGKSVQLKSHIPSDESTRNLQHSLNGNLRLAQAVQSRRAARTPRLLAWVPMVCQQSISRAQGRWTESVGVSCCKLLCTHLKCRSVSIVESVQLVTVVSDPNTSRVLKKRYIKKNKFNNEQNTSNQSKKGKSEFVGCQLDVEAVQRPQAQAGNEARELNGAHSGCAGARMSVTWAQQQI